ncbi:YIP1 family protein [Bacillus ndiopicus]|uniref:YIP1 family protein n=1 Tax=Bacillus ndiopicus TaxID=1347368 RepID=UPI0005A97A8F|nr:YIP1 family protein [Bacillus ndiopicus]
MNPFFSAWLHPKQTARYIIENKSMGYVIFIISIGHIGSFLSSLKDINFNIDPWLLLVASVILSPVLAIIGNSISAWIFWQVGKLYDGIATYKELFKGLSAGAIPSVVLIPFFSIWLLTSPDSFIYREYMGPIPWIALPALLLAAVTSIWSIVISVAVVAELHQISTWKAIGTVIIPSIILAILIVILTIVVVEAFLI